MQTARSQPVEQNNFSIDYNAAEEGRSMYQINPERLSGAKSFTTALLLSTSAAMTDE